jgi:hypothetical protein
MKKINVTIVWTIVLATCFALIAPAEVLAKGEDFNAAVKAVEQFYHVKHQSIPLLARAGMKTATTAARITGGDYKRLAETGSVKIVFFEDQDFDSRGSIAAFKTSLTTALGDTWSPLVRTLEPKDESQTHIFIREAGDKFNVLVVTLERHEGVVVQVNLSPRNLALLMQDPNEMGKAITDDANRDDN